jgi:PAS domain S-box-containing protein
VPVVLTAALFWSWRAAALLALVSAGLVVASAGLASALGLPTPPLMSPTARAWLFVGSLAMTTVLTGAAMRALRDAVADEHRRARELLALFRENPDAIVVLDDTGILREINPAALAVGGLPEREVVGRHFASVPVFSASDAALAIRRFSALLRGAKRTFALRLSRADGSVFWGDARARVIVGDDGTKRVQVTVRDVTRSRMAEQRRVELEGHLLKLQRFETIGRLSGAVAHDVNNLLSIVALVASSLRNRLGPETRELADELCDSAVRAAKLNRRLLLLGRHDVVKREPVDINLVIDGMRRLLDRLAGESLELIVRLDPGRCIVRADAAQLEQLIINLVTNARDAMPKEGRLTIETQRSTTPTSDGRTGESVVVRVSDTGVGMDPATQRHMFEPFFTTKGSAGTGLGLAAVRDIVNACGGGIRVESQPGLGTRFEVVLPALTVSGYAASGVSDAGE